MRSKKYSLSRYLGPLRSRFFLATIVFILVVETAVLFFVIYGISWLVDDIQRAIFLSLGFRIGGYFLERLEQITRNYAFMVTLTFVAVSAIICGGFYWFLRHWVFAPLQLILETDREARNEGVKLIPEEKIPPTEIGLVMKSRNDMLRALEDIYSEEAIETLVRAVDAKDNYTYGHSRRVSWLAREIGRKANCPPEQIELLERAGTLHDIGKLGISDKILRKTGSLNEREQSILEDHPDKAVEMIQLLQLDSNVLEGIRYHHERFDGTGYPEGLEGEDIPLFGRILGVADGIDAILNRRNGDSTSIDDAIRECKRRSGIQFDPRLSRSAVTVLEQTDRTGVEFLTEH